MIDISLILPTRGRPRQALRALDSVAQTADSPARIEVVLYVDHDDEDSHEIEHPTLEIVRLIEPRAKMGQITQRCYERSRGRYIMLVNDDMVFGTPGWDRVLIDTIEEFDDGIALVWGNDLHSGGPAHPFLSRTTCELMDGVCPEDYSREFIDTHLYDIFRKLKYHGHDRLRYLPDLVFEHLHVYAGKAEVDSTYEKPGYVDDERLYIAWDDERSLVAERLRQTIESCSHGTTESSAIIPAGRLVA